MSKEFDVLGALYLVGVPLFAFLAWVFSEALHAGELDDRHFRHLLSVLAGALWPLMLVGVGQMLGVWIIGKVSRARRLSPADRRLISNMPARPEHL